jgi:FKBP-type peptidyl-prolyl cis-trans isomerase SlyD
MSIQKNSVVTMHYELKDAAGEVLDSSSGGEPLVFLHGASNIIVGLEEELEGKSVGETVNAIVSPEKGYGMPVDALVQQVPKAAFGDEIDDIKVGMKFQAETEQGPVPVQVTSIEDDIVTVDGNHPLAGKELHFKCSIAEIRTASAEEIEHGHVHGVGGHAH